MNKKEGKPADGPIVLPHFFGIRPGIYISIFCALAILLAVFLVGFLPGILKGGRNYSFTSSSGPVAVTIDGIYKGGTPFEIFIPSGQHEAVYSRNGITVASETFTTGHPVFLTWLFPRRSHIEIPVRAFSSDEIQSLTDDFLSVLAQRSLILSFDASSPFSSVFTPWARDMAAFAAPSAQDTINDVFTLASGFITSPELMADAQEAALILSSAGFSVPQDVLARAETILQGTATDDSSTLSTSVTSADSGSSTRLVTSILTLEGISFEAQDFSMGNNSMLSFPEVIERQITVSSDSFSLAATPVTEYHWALFMQANPYWASSNKARLIEDGMVDENYLAGIYPSLSVPSQRPIRGISHHAAQAFVAWLSELSGRHVFLPTEVQWSRAAMTVSQDDFQTTLTSSGTTNLSGMLGGVWEMTDTVFIPLARASDDYAGLQKLSSLMPDDVPVVIKGGSFLSDPLLVTSHTAGVAGPSECSDYMGFRVAWE